MAAEVVDNPSKRLFDAIQSGDAAAMETIFRSIMSEEVEVNPSGRLFDAIHNGNVAEIETILDAYPDIVNTKHATGWSGWGMVTPLMENFSSHARSSTRRVANCLVQRGADVNATGHLVLSLTQNSLGLLPGDAGLVEHFHRRLGVHDDLFPLYIAVQQQHTYKIEILLGLGGMNIDQRTAAGETALHQACRAFVDEIDDFGNLIVDKFIDSGEDTTTLGIVRMLIENGADVNCQDNLGMTPLHHACQKGKLHTVQILLDNRADITIKDGKNRTPLEYAALQNYDLAESLLKECTNISCQARIEAYEIMASCDSCPNAYKVLLKAMHLRREYEIPKVAEKPLGCYKNVKECETLEELVLCEQDPALTMIYAILARERIFKRKFFDLNKDMDYFAEEAFRQAGLTNMNELQLRHIGLLEENGAYIDFGSSFTTSNAILKSLALGSTHPFTMENNVILKTVELLFKSLSKVQEELNAAVKPGLIEQLIVQFKVNMLYVTFYLCMLFKRALLPYDGYAEGKGERVSTPENDLSLLSDIFHKLWKQFPVLESPNSGHMTPLPHFTFDRSYWASGFGHSGEYIQYHPQVLKLFIDQGFDVDSVDSNGNTLLHVVASAHPNYELVKILLENGADCFCRNINRLTALDVVKDPSVQDPEDDVIELLELYMYTKVPSLKCHAAITVRDWNLPYKDPENFPQDLISFVDAH